MKNTNGHICSYDYKKTINEGTNGKCMDKKQDNPQMFKNFEKLIKLTFIIVCLNQNCTHQLKNIIIKIENTIESRCTRNRYWAPYIYIYILELKVDVPEIDEV